MRKILNYCFLIVVGLALYFCFWKMSESVPFTYYDEFWWINDSYLSEYYFKADWFDPVWKSQDAIDQPMLTRDIFALVLYPDYIRQSWRIKEKPKNEVITYSKYLIFNGFFYSSTNNTINKETYLASVSKIARIDPNDGGNKHELVDKYGYSILKPIALIQKARNINVFLLTLSILIAYILFLKNNGKIFAGLFVFFMAINPTLITTCLKSHAEPLFLLLWIVFLTAVTKINKNITNKQIIVISLIIALSVSTKLNGIIMYPIFITYLLLTEYTNKKRINYKVILHKAVITGIISLTVFTLINPFVLNSPIFGFIKMYEYRWNVSEWQSQYFKAASLPDIPARVFELYKHSLIVNIPNIPGYLMNLISFIILLIGLRSEVRKMSGDRIRLTIFISFILLFVYMLVYLKMNWDRYFIPIVIFNVYFQAAGIEIILIILSKAIKKFYKYNLIYKE